MGRVVDSWWLLEWLGVTLFWTLEVFLTLQFLVYIYDRTEITIVKLFECFGWLAALMPSYALTGLNKFANRYSLVLVLCCALIKMPMQVANCSLLLCFWTSGLKAWHIRLRRLVCSLHHVSSLICGWWTISAELRIVWSMETLICGCSTACWWSIYEAFRRWTSDVASPVTVILVGPTNISRSRPGANW